MLDSIPSDHVSFGAADGAAGFARSFFEEACNAG